MDSKELTIHIPVTHTHYKVFNLSDEKMTPIVLVGGNMDKSQNHALGISFFRISSVKDVVL